MLQILKQLRIGLLALPFLLQGLGGVANLAVLTANHGSMPVVIPVPIREELKGEDSLTPGEVLDEVHTVYNPQDIHLKVLCDWIQVPRVGTVSPGDLLLWAGEWSVSPVFFLWLALLYSDKRQEIREY